LIVINGLLEHAGEFLLSFLPHFELVRVVSGKGAASAKFGELPRA
jgi:hypothetical protein